MLKALCEERGSLVLYMRSVRDTERDRQRGLEGGVEREREREREGGRDSGKSSRVCLPSLALLGWLCVPAALYM